MAKIESSHVLEYLKRDKRFWVAFIVMALIVLGILLAPAIAPYAPGEAQIVDRLCPTSSAHILGCNLDGGDVFTDLLYGGRTSFYISFLTVLISVSIGTCLGLMSGYWGGSFDFVLMRLVDILMAFPGILLAMVLSAVMGPSVHNVVFAISATGWIATTRLIRGQVLTLREREYVVAAQSLGVRTPQLLVKHILPMLWAPLIIQATFSISGVIIVESSLSFLGLGAQKGALSWGALLSQGKEVLTEAPLLSLAPGLAIVVVVLSLNALGDSLRDILDPKTLKS